MKSVTSVPWGVLVALTLGCLGVAMGCSRGPTPSGGQVGQSPRPLAEDGSGGARPARPPVGPPVGVQAETTSSTDAPEVPTAWKTHLEKLPGSEVTLRAFDVTQGVRVRGRSVENPLLHLGGGARNAGPWSESVMRVAIAEMDAEGVPRIRIAGTRSSGAEHPYEASSSWFIAKLVGERGEPVSEARGSWEWRCAGSSVTGTAHPDDEGRFAVLVFWKLDAPIEHVDVRVEASGYVGTEHRFSRSEWSSERQIVLTASGSISGVCIDSSGMPTSDVRISNAYSRADVSPNDDGRFRVSGLPVGQSTTLLFIYGDGSIREVPDVVVAEATDIGVVTPAPGRVVHGRVTGRDGVPVPGAKIAIVATVMHGAPVSGRYVGTRLVLGRTTSGPNGEFEIRGVLRRTVTLRVGRAGESAPAREIVVDRESDGELSVSLVRRTVWVDPGAFATGELRRAPVRVTFSPNGEPEGSVTVAGNLEWLPRQWHTFDDARFVEIRVDVWEETCIEGRRVLLSDDSVTRVKIEQEIARLHDRLTRESE